MLLISQDEFYKLQESYNLEYSKFIDLIESGSLLESKVYDNPRNYISTIVKYSLIGTLEYPYLNILISNIMIDNEKLFFFKDIHTKQEIHSFLKEIVKNIAN